MSDALDRFEGALLGTCVGDALGMPVEGWDPSEIHARFGALTDMQEARLGRGTYTDDTEMMIALAESLIKSRRLDPGDLAQSFIQNHHPNRGYGAGSTQVLALLRKGTPWTRAALNVFPGGSYGNGCAMRVAPLGLFYWKKTAALKEAAYGQSQVTHAHPLAQEGSYLQTLAVARLVNLEKEALHPAGFLAQLCQKISLQAVSFLKAYEVIEGLLAQKPKEEEVIDRLGHDSRVIRSQPTALYAFLSHPQSFEEALVYAVSLGGDADTIAAMTGALAGAYHGARAIPRRWLEALENGEKGRDYIRDLASQLHRLTLSEEVHT